MLNDLIVLEVIAHIFPMHKKMKQLLRRRIQIFLVLSEEMMVFFYTSLWVIRESSTLALIS